MVEVWCLKGPSGILHPGTAGWGCGDVEAALKAVYHCNGKDIKELIDDGFAIVPCELVEVEHAERTENT